MNTKTIIREGFIPFRQYKLWYRSIATDVVETKLPILCLHGGPGIPSDYLEPLEGMAENGHQVIRFDQLGCGNSDQPNNPSMWKIPLFVEQVATVRQFLNLDEIHLLGQSWGGMLAMEYTLTQPAGLASLILASSLASIPQWMKEANRLRNELPIGIQRTLEQHESEGTTTSLAYQDAMLVYYHRHICRLNPWPDCVERAFAKLSKNPEVYNTMWGPSEFYASGTLRKWDITSRLGEIRVPTLVTSGRYDEATPEVAQTLTQGIPGSVGIVLEDGSHFVHVEKPKQYLDILNNFIAGVESQRLLSMRAQ
ncbi:MAG: proline iminopeptidase-family hydrolase [Anaerolineaceae bacterium]|nr:proline iminopeptidase-family hydrolase [Anaerolineaceae bacterium]